MKQIIGRQLILGLLLFTALLSLVPSRVFAIAGTVRFDPNGGPVVNGNEFTVNVLGSVPDPGGIWGGGTTMIVNYDATKLQVVSYNDEGGAFQSATKNWSGTTSGTVKYTANVYWNAPGVNGKIISIKFKAISTGSATLSFGSGTSVNDGPTTGTPSTFTLLAPTCPAGQVGTPPNCTTPAPSPTPKPSTTPKPTTTTKPTPKPVVTPVPTPTPTVEETPAPIVESDGGLRIEDVKITTNRQTNIVSWTLNKAEAVPVVTYGLSKNSMKSEATISTLDDGGYKAEFESLKLGTLYYFTIKASTPDNLQGATYSGTFTTRGYPVQLTVQQNGVLAPGAKVVIGSRSFYANKNALIATEFGDGTFTAQVTPSGATKSYPASFTVAKKAIPANGNPDLQTFTLNIAIDGSNSATDDGAVAIIIGGILAALAGIGGFIGFLIYRRKNNEQADPNAVDSDLLAANYGALENYTSNTPAPNLDASAVTPLATEQAPAVSNEFTPQDAANQMPIDQAAPTYQEPANTPPLEPSQNPTAFDPASLPLPPAPQDPSNTAYYQPTADEPTAPQIDEQESYQSAELAQIESESLPETLSNNPDEPSAVYDASTGELAIIHHHAAAPAPTTSDLPVDQPAVDQAATMQLPPVDYPQEANVSAPEPSQYTPPAIPTPSTPTPALLPSTPPAVAS